MPVKSKVEISQNFVAFSEYMNFTIMAILDFFNHSRSQFEKMGMEFFPQIQNIFVWFSYYKCSLFSEDFFLSHLQIAQQNHCPLTCQSMILDSDLAQ